jgi:hypothetical protein
MRIRLNDTTDEIELYAAALRAAFDVVDESPNYPNSGKSLLWRRYMDIRLKPETAAPVEAESDSYAGRDGGARLSWHTIRLYRGEHPFEPGLHDLAQVVHASECAALPPGARCWFDVDPCRGSWPAIHDGTYRIRRICYISGGGEDGPDYTDAVEIQHLDDATGQWSDWHGETLSQQRAPATEATPRTAFERARIRFHQACTAAVGLDSDAATAAATDAAVEDYNHAVDVYNLAMGLLDGQGALFHVTRTEAGFIGRKAGL